MSDLFCAATVLVACSGEAEYVRPCLSDEGGTLSWHGREQATALAGRLAGRRVARVWSSDASRAVQAAEIVAHQLSVGVQTHPDLRQVGVGDLLGTPYDASVLDAVTDRWHAGDLAAGFPGGETGQDVVARVGGQLREIADQHRGETVLVIGHRRSGRAALEALVGNRTRGRCPGFDEPVEVILDADGVRLVE